MIIEFNKGFSLGSQAKFAREMNITPQLVNSWLKGKSVPSPANMEKLSKIFNKSQEEIQGVFTQNLEEQYVTDDDKILKYKEKIKLLEEKIKILEERNSFLEEQIKFYKENFKR
ncbi:MAG: helix-turn-helix transcriptional regulator [Elusimicrobia bacterium]|nr:helix-turn-helix transcriptional regulator [Elusimicrobiota bacterium]